MNSRVSFNRRDHGTTGTSPGGSRPRGVVTVVLFLIGVIGVPFAHATDLRNIRNGLEIPSENYADQPYCVITPTGDWLVVLTTGPNHEGTPGQHIISTVSTDQGQTWSTPVDIEPSSGPEASWAVPLITPSGRIYAFYTYNDTDCPSHYRRDMLGSYMYKYTDDFGSTWSTERYELPMRVTDVDRNNSFGGAYQMFWGVDKPSVYDGKVYFAFSKIGTHLVDDTEGWVFRSNNVLTETDPTAVNWEMLPEGEYGIRSPSLGSVQAEHNLVPLGNDDFYMIYRTTNGSPAHTYSRDGGATWTEPVHATYTPGGRRIKHPRANAKVWKAENGKYLLWYHNNGRQDFNGRNPVWLAGGVEVDGMIHWSQPEIVLYDPSVNTRISYPDLIEQDGRYWITETNKTTARVHEIDAAMLEGLWTQGQVNELTQDGLALSWDSSGGPSGQVAMPTLPDLAQNGGFSFDFWINLNDLSAGQTIADSRNAQGKGIVVKTGGGNNIEIAFSDGTNQSSWTSDSGTLMCDRTHHVAVIVDGGPDIITFLVDGIVNDGGQERTHGWGRFSSSISDINGSDTLDIAPSLNGELNALRLYDRYLYNSEAIANFWAGGGSPPYVPPMVSTTLSYDGSYDPYGTPPQGQTQWVRQGALIDPILVNPPEGAMARILDDGTVLGQRVQISHELDGVQKNEWAYEIRMDLVSGNDGSGLAVFGIGVRDEGGIGKSIWINWYADGLFFLDNSARKNGSAIEITDEHYRGTGFHTYRVMKFWDDDEFKIQVFVDDEPQFDTPLSYNSFPDDATTDRGFGLFTASPSTSDSYLDYMKFGAFSEFYIMAGDANFDGVVNDLDASILAANWQKTGVAWAGGDFNGDGVVNDTDASILAAHWQQGGVEAHVPEPHVAVLLAAVVLLGWLPVRSRYVPFSPRRIPVA